LRAFADLKSNLLLLFRDKGLESITENDIEIQKQNRSCFAFIICNDVDIVIQKLNGLEFDGRKLVAERERKKGSTTNMSFGGGWAGPTKSKSLTKEIQSRPIATESLQNQILQENEKDVNEQDGIALVDFRSRCQQPLRDLLSELGEFDPNFKKVTLDRDPIDRSQVSILTEKSDSRSMSKLGKCGKAPLHVEFQSFGFMFGAPTRSCFSHAQPLLTLDCREFPTVPAYLNHKPGISFDVKRVLLTDELKETISKLSENVFNSLFDAIQDGHGYALPLRMTIYVGSEIGRHRSVIACEEAAKLLRNHLRMNKESRIQIDVSVGTSHPDMDRRRDLGRSKKNEIDDE
jgi:hypothetical protein